VHSGLTYKLRQQDIPQYICTLRKWHKIDNKNKSHFQAGEKKCRTCNLYYKSTWNSIRCAHCHIKLAIKSHTAKHNDI
jgi:hypothetical protein